MTSALIILERSFRPIDVPRTLPRSQPQIAGIYMLVDGDEIVYVGSSRDIINRLYTHTVERSEPLTKRFDRAIFYALPPKVHSFYEGAFIRKLCPRFCRSAPKHRGCDNEILEGFGLPRHRNEHENAEAWQMFRSDRVKPDPGDLARTLRDLRRRARMTAPLLAEIVGVKAQVVATGLIAIAVIAPLADVLARRDVINAQTACRRAGGEVLLSDDGTWRCVPVEER